MLCALGKHMPIPLTDPVPFRSRLGPDWDNDGAWVVNPSFDAPDAGATAPLLLVSLGAMGFLARRNGRSPLRAGE